jgi:O-antigen ligase/tetratricopeptide (TPR) repeat protein
MKNQSNPLLLIVAALYLIVHFIPDFGGADVMGAQWLYTSVLDILVLGYLLWNRKDYAESIAAVFSQKFTLLYTFYFVWALASVSYAINVTEAIVCLARLVSTFFIFTNIAILLYQKDIKSYYLPISFLISIVLFYDSLQMLVGFSNNMYTMNLDQNILSLKGNNGNKNVMAASLLIKVPFALFVALRSKLAGRIFGLLSIFIGVFALFVLNTRSTYVGLLLIIILFTVTTIYYRYKDDKNKIALQLGYLVVPVVIAFFCANLVLGNAIKMQESQGGYGTVTKRIGDITVASEKGSRLHLWQAGLDYFSKHPFIGDGYGNWKLASIPYEKEFTNDLFVPYHSHNDFIEAAADLGILGGLAYLGLFVLAFIFTLQLWFKKEHKEYRFFATISFMALTCYFVDAFLNFPTERTSMQTMLTLTAALLFAPAYLMPIAKKPIGVKIIPTVYFVVGLLLIGYSINVNNQVYDSLKVQRFVMGEIDADPKMALADVESAFPKYPNLSTSALPIKALVARYQFRDKHYDEALRLLNESEKDNPYLHYNDFIRTAIYGAKQNYDSTAYYAYAAFFNWPRATSYYKNALFAAAKKRDTVQINKAFNLYNKYRTSAEAYHQYLLALYEVKGGADKRMIDLLDTAFKKFPGDSALLASTRNIIARGAAGAGAAAGVPNINQNSAKGVQAFQKGNFAVAANYYIKASEEEPNNFTHFENIGICFYSNKNYDKCLAYFDRANQFAANTSGKSSFFKALALIAMGKKELVCAALADAKKKNYPGVDTYIAANCK